MIQYHKKRIQELLRVAEDEAARSNFHAAIYRLSDAVEAAVACIDELAEKADVA